MGIIYTIIPVLPCVIQWYMIQNQFTMFTAIFTDSPSFLSYIAISNSTMKPNGMLYDCIFDHHIIGHHASQCLLNYLCMYKDYKDKALVMLIVNLYFTFSVE